MSTSISDSRKREPIRFAYWVPNVSGGLVVSKIPQRTELGLRIQPQAGALAENNGFDYALSQVRYMASYGAEFQHESTSFSLALLLATQRLKVIAADPPRVLAAGGAGQAAGHRRPPVERPVPRSTS